MIWEDTSNLPFPTDIKPLLKDIKWDQFEWHVFGLPVPFGKFSMSGGKTLYLSELPNGVVKVEKMSDFTGNIAMGGYFLDDSEDGYNYFVQFVVTICKGEVLEVNVHTVQKQPVQEFRHAMEDFQANVNKVIKRTESWWFKWLYHPWFLVVRGIGFVFLFLIKVARDIVVWIVKKLTPL